MLARTPTPRLRGRRAVDQRKRRLSAEPLCRDCRALGRVTESTVPDHIIPLGKGGSDTDDNIRCLCDEHHRIRTAEQFNYQQKPTIGVDGWPVWDTKPRMDDTHPEWLPKPSCQVIVVTGPPGAGKSTYCQNHSTSADVVIDLDDCFAEVCGTHGHELDDTNKKAHLSDALTLRNQKLKALSGKETGKAFLIVGAPTQEECNWWVNKLYATHVRIDPGMHVCVRRVCPHRYDAKVIEAWYEKKESEWTRKIFKARGESS